MPVRVRRVPNGPLLFECPGCECLHGIDDRWSFNGDYERPTFEPSYRSRFPGNVCHSFIRDGRIQFLSDSTHRLAGQTVDLPEI